MPRQTPQRESDGSPYVAPRGDATIADGIPRTWFWTGLILFQAICYAAFVSFFGFAGILILESAMSVSARPDEIVLTLLALAATPVVAGFLIMELRGIRSAMAERERLLSWFSMLTTIVPAGLSLFGFYEYLAFGHFQANAVPAFFTLAFAILWFMLGYSRWKRAPQSP